jgi:HEAT repeat protein
MAKDFDELVRDLEDESRMVRRDAAESLGKLGDARAVEPLIVALEDKDSSVRSSAANALGRLGDACAVEPLITALGDEDQQVRWTAAKALGELGDTHAMEPLIIALGDEDQQVRWAAAKALGGLGDARAVEPLIAALEDRDRQVRRATAEALDRLDWEPSENTTGAVYWIVKQDWDQCVALGTLAVEPLIASLEAQDWHGRRAVVKALGKIGDARAVEPLIATLKDKDLRVRTAALTALSKFDDARVIEMFKKPYEYEVKTLPLVLVAEDERDIRELIAFSLRFGGFEVEEAANGTEAVEKARKLRPDLIIMDVRMPKKTGYEACQELKAADGTRDISVVFLSAKGQEAEVKQGMELGAVDYIVKPFEAEQLPSLIAEIFRGIRLGIY